MGVQGADGVSYCNDAISVLPGISNELLLCRTVGIEISALSLSGSGGRGGRIVMRGESGGEGGRSGSALIVGDVDDMRDRARAAEMNELCGDSINE